ncbi:DUF2948 family protein [Pararhizobium mangrovi]|uniref:DUF2948 family protein n=1 Tax=Pararhizobium mangrovi TaxID=2590452 RepID=A0A506U2V4_9HYPH|nr:DUF2948 family protein [Pararhizobium mangrovi]TPW26197.1 DUF2948 family protein [Pararhizobium mangrovi]
MDEDRRLKLYGLDTEDLGIVSAHAQDAIVKVGDMEYVPRRHQFSLVCNRFVWEKAGGRNQRRFERRHAVLHFDRVQRVRIFGVDRGRPDTVLSLLSLTYTPSGEPPSGEIELVFADDVSVVLDVECIEVELADQAGAWETDRKPRHPVS